MSSLEIFAACTTGVGRLCVDSLPKGDASSANIQAMIQIFTTILGAVALLVIVLAGMRYILSQGDAQKVTQAKNAIIYALIGLVVALLAQVIVAFVVGNV